MRNDVQTNKIQNSNLFSCPVIDMHVHLRDNPVEHLKILEASGYAEVAAMANTSEVLDDIKKINKYLELCANARVVVHLFSALSRGLRGRELVKVNQLRPKVAGFSDDGKCLSDLKLLEIAFNENVLIAAHLEPETEMLDKYLFVLEKCGRGRLHCQHISKRSSLFLIAKAKQKNLPVTAETCPQYLYSDNKTEDVNINPPLGSEQDRSALLESLSSGIIDCIASDYAPLPRKSGLAGARMFFPLCFGLVLNGVLTEQQLKEKISINPLKIIKNSHA